MRRTLVYITYFFVLVLGVGIVVLGNIDARPPVTHAGLGILFSGVFLFLNARISDLEYSAMVLFDAKRDFVLRRAELEAVFEDFRTILKKSGEAMETKKSNDPPTNDPG